MYRMPPYEFYSILEKFGEAIHEDYRKNELAKGNHVVPWEELDEKYRYSSIRQALTYPDKLDVIGCYIARRGEGKPVRVTKEEKEIMSKKEHELWVMEKEADKWVYDEVRDEGNHLHTCLVPWSKLSEEERDKDRAAVKLMVKLIYKNNFIICRYDKPKPREDPFYKTTPGVPLIIGISGHIDVSPEDEGVVKQRIQALLDSYRKRYIHTEIVLMTGLAEGSDRIAAKAALELGIHVAPVLPKDKDTFRGSFTGKGYTGLDPVRESIEDFDRILNNGYEGVPEGAGKLVYTECVMDASDVNNRKAYRDQVAFISSNSHVLIAVWDGKETISKGGTYDCLRMALTGIDPDLVDKITPMSSADVTSINLQPRYLSAAEDTLVYWIRIERGSERKGPSDGSAAYIVHKQLLEGPDDGSSDGTMSRAVGEIARLVVGLGRASERLVKDGIFRREKQKLEQIHRSENVIEGSVPLFSKELVLSAEVPYAYDQSFRKIDLFNREIGISDYTQGYKLSEEMKDEVEEFKAKGTHRLFPKDEGMENSDYLKEMKWTYYSSCYLADYWKKKNEFNIRLLIVLTALQSIFFSMMILFSNSLALMAVYAILYVIFLGFSFWHIGREEHLKFVEYSSLSQSLMVQYYWSILGINDSVSMNCYAYIKNRMIWIRFLMKSFCSPFCNDYYLPTKLDMNKRLDAIIDSWINDSRVKVGEYTKEARKRRTGLKGKETVFTIINALISASVVVLALFISIYSMKLFDMDQWTVGAWTLFPETEITWFIVVKIVLIFVASITALFSLQEKTNYDVDEDQMKATAMLLDMAASKISMQENTTEEKITRTKLSIIHELGTQIVNSSNDWVFKFIDQDIGKVDKKGGMDTLDVRR